LRWSRPIRFGFGAQRVFADGADERLLFGGYDDETAPPRESTGAKRPRLIISGSAVFGGVSVKN